MFRNIDNRFARIGAYVLMAIAGVIGLLIVDSVASDAKESAENAEVAAEAAERAIEAVQAESEARAVAVCEGGNENREILLQLVEGSNNAQDFEAVPGFEDLDPAMQQYLRNLSPERPGEDGEPEPSDLLIAARELLAPKDCNNLPSR